VHYWDADDPDRIPKEYYTERVVVMRCRRNFGLGVYYNEESNSGNWRRSIHFDIPFFGNIEVRWGRIEEEE